MRRVSIATCTSVEPVSCSCRPCFPINSSFASLVRLTLSSSCRRLRRPRTPRRKHARGRDCGRRKGSSASPGIGSLTRMSTSLPAAVAAGHPATAQAGLEILEDGGSAADAAVAACLASCVAETIMTGLLGGGHAIYLSAARGTVRNLDFFVAVPSGSGDELEELAVPFGEELVHYAIGAASAAVPGVPAGLDALWRAHGRLPWPRLCEPALALARDGVELTPAHASCLAMLAPVMTMREGARIYCRNGALLTAGERLEQPGLVPALEAISAEGADAVYRGSI